MSSSGAETPSQQSPPLADQTRGGFSLFIPFILGLPTAAPPPTQGGDENQTGPEGLLFINPLIWPMIMMQRSGNLDQLNKEGPLPASKAAIDAMPAMTITEDLVSESESESCAICLGEYEVGGEAKEMPCKHRYHSGCIVKWLGIHGSCPVCRYEMPVEEEKKGSEGESGGRRLAGEIRISLFFGGGGDSTDGSSTQDMEIDDN